MPDSFLLPLPVDGPYDLSGSLAVIRDSPSYLLEDLSSPGLYRRVLAAGGRCAEVTVRQDPVRTGSLLAEILFPEAPLGSLPDRVPEPGEDPDSAARIFLPLLRRIFSLNFPAGDFHRILEADPVLGKTMASFRNIRPVGFGSVFEALVFAIMEQQVSAASARSLKRRFLEEFGTRVVRRDREADRTKGAFLWRFPEPSDLSGADETAFRSLGLSRQKASSLYSLVAAIRSGDFDLPAFEAMAASENAEKMVERLMGLRGIGRWSAEYVLMRGICRPDLLCASDLALRTILARHYGESAPLPADRVRKIAERWRGFEGWIGHLWWFVGRNPP